jgi:DNA-binding response OmpR family regulator
MPGMTGLQLVAELRRKEDHIPVLLMCGLLSSEIITRATELGIRRLLAKPTEPDDLLKIVDNLLKDAQRPSET